MLSEWMNTGFVLGWSSFKFKPKFLLALEHLGK